MTEHVSNILHHCTWQHERFHYVTFSHKPIAQTVLSEVGNWMCWFNW